MPHILQTGNIKDGKRPTKLEAQEAFINIFETLEEANDGDLHEPHIVVIGTDLLNIETTYLVMANQKIYFENPIEAIERCFYYFLGLDVPYPPQANHIWYFVQKCIYNISVGSQQLIPIIDDFCNELNKAKP